MIALAAAAGLSLLPRVAGAAPDRTGRVTPDAPFTWQGTQGTGFHYYYPESGEPCGKTIDEFCDVTLLHVDVPPSFWDARAGGVTVRISDYQPNPRAFFGLYVYESDASGKRGRLVSGAAFEPTLSVTVTDASGYYLVQVAYWFVTESRYSGEAKFFLRSRFPLDVDDPPGVQEYLASDPAKGFRSHSEPHVAQSPVDPNLLVAGSKMYNRDPDSLAEYEFKIGTYVSFDGAVTWHDLGQLAVCPPEAAPPESWPNNTCYPDEDPAKGGTEGEDLDDPDDDADVFDPRGTGDFGEEYITSDVWVQLDDEGNAYAMVLDSPPFESGSGWGMTLHVWESVSAPDVASGKTWGPRIPINSYPTEPQQFLFLDDKNTFAVNNAGPDGDGRVGPMVACWGQNVFPAKQQIVCERSTNSGRSWPDPPAPVSGAQHLAIGVHAVADTRDENVFYAVWLHYVPGLVGAPDEMWVAKTIDGGQSWLPPVRAAGLTGLPRTFPGQSFRNFSLPIAGVGPNGEVYVTYADYRPAPQPGDEDGMQADIMLVRSTDGGITWSDPVKVNQDSTNADQFQPYVAVTPKGQVNVAFFDRRNDPKAPGHPGNFFIDAYLARSNDGGSTFKETRLSHDAWDPTVNPPISPSGEFIGDYQGLVADDCKAVAFMNDTHLANPASRDPDLDRGLPRSQYQEVFAWVAANPGGTCVLGERITQAKPAPATGGSSALAATGRWATTAAGALLLLAGLAMGARLRDSRN